MEQKTITNFLLCSAVLFSFSVPQGNLYAHPQPSWKRTITLLFMQAAIGVLLNGTLQAIFEKTKSKETLEREKIESLLAINSAMKNQMDYLRRKFRSHRIVKEMEKKYLHACNKIMEMQEQYLTKYSNQNKENIHKK